MPCDEPHSPSLYSNEPYPIGMALADLSLSLSNSTNSARDGVYSLLSDEDKILGITEHMRAILELLGLDVSDPSIAKTPERVARMYVKELFAGLDPDRFPTMTFVEDVHDNTSSETHTSERMVFLQTRFTSMCEHHFVPFIGTAYIGYAPKTRLLGLSKLARIVRYFASRPQLQERLNRQIADALTTLLQTEDVAVSLSASHLCMIARGVEDHASLATTHVLRGRFQHDALLRESFLFSTKGSPSCVG